MAKQIRPSVSIGDAVEALRAELAEAIQRGEGKDLRFQVETIDLELAISGELSAGGKLSFSVFGIGATAEAGGKATSTHRVKLSLKPVDNEGKSKTTLLGR